YVVDSDPKEDEEDPKEDHADYPADRGDNDDDESSNDDDDHDDVEKDEEDKEEEHLALADPSDVSTDDPETMKTVNQWMSVEEIKRVVAQRVANAIEAIAIYETKTNIALKSMSQTKRQKENVAENDSTKWKWEGNHNGSSSQQNKGHKVPRVHTAWPINKKAYAGSLPLTPATAKNQRTRTCYECGSLRHYKSEVLIVKFQKRVDMIHGGDSVVHQAENKRKLDNTSKNNQNQQQPNKRQNTGRAYTAWYGEKKHYSGSKLLCSKCNYHHDGPCAPKCHKCNRVGHLARNCRSSTNDNTTNIQKGTGAGQKATCYECGNQGHYRRDCLKRKNQNHENQIKTLSPGYVVDSDPKKDENDPKEDPADYPADRGNNGDDESSNDDDDDDDVEKDEEDKEEEHLAPADPSDVSTDDLVP
nr:hypothetical protein [Tanacetum cinerariifolium]